MSLLGVFDPFRSDREMHGQRDQRYCRAKDDKHYKVCLKLGFRKTHSDGDRERNDLIHQKPLR